MWIITTKKKLIIFTVSILLQYCTVILLREYSYKIVKNTVEVIMQCVRLFFNYKRIFISLTISITEIFNNPLKIHLNIYYLVILVFILLLNYLIEWIGGNNINCGWKKVFG